MSGDYEGVLGVTVVEGHIGLEVIVLVSFPG